MNWNPSFSHVPVPHMLTPSSVTVLFSNHNNVLCGLKPDTVAMMSCVDEWSSWETVKKPWFTEEFNFKWLVPLGSTVKYNSLMMWPFYCLPKVICKLWEMVGDTSSKLKQMHVLYYNHCSRGHDLHGRRVGLWLKGHGFNCPDVPLSKAINICSPAYCAKKCMI